MLLFKEQRYKIESNSQRSCTIFFMACGCCSKSKDTKLKAIHNTLVNDFLRIALLFKEQRYKIESNSQLLLNSYQHQLCCCSKSKDTKLKAIHNVIGSCIRVHEVVVQRAKIQNWKQFTTRIQHLRNFWRLLFKEQRYKIESNSQQERSCGVFSSCCCSKSKDTKLKAIHNYCII